MKKRKLLTVLSSVSLISNSLIPITYVVAESDQAQELEERQDGDENISPSATIESNEGTHESTTGESTQAEEHVLEEVVDEEGSSEANSDISDTLGADNTIPGPIDGSVEQQEQVDDSEKNDLDDIDVQEDSEEVFSLEENRELAMKIMEEDLQRKNSRIMLFSAFSHVDEFINKFSPLAVKYANANGLYPSVMLAQAALESGWGRSSLSQSPYHQLFGIKDSSGFTGDVIEVPTKEWVRDKSKPEGGYYITIDAKFRVYDSHEGSFRDQANFLQKPRYTNVLIKNAPSYEDATQALQSAGYATDPEYTSKLNSIIKNYNLDRFDGLPSISYSSHVQTYGWLDAVNAGQRSGTSGEKKRLEAFNVNIANFDGVNIQYSSFIDGKGWDNWVTNGEVTGTTGEGRRIEAITMKLTGSQAGNFDLYYRTHVESFGWLDWSKNGEINGAEDILNKRVEAIEVVVVKKGQPAPGATKATYKVDNSNVSYSSHVQSHGWQDYVNSGATSGTTGEKKRMEALRIGLQNTLIRGGIEYRTHVQSYGWLDWVSNNKISGTTGESKRAEAIQIRLTGEIAKYYDVYYRTHSQKVGWLDWAKNGEPAGTEGKALRLESIQIRLVRKDHKAPGNTTQPFIK